MGCIVRQLTATSVKMSKELVKASKENGALAMISSTFTAKILGTMRSSSSAPTIGRTWHDPCSLLRTLKPRKEVPSQEAGGRVLDDIISPAQAAALLRLNVKTIYKLAERGAIPGKRFGRSWRFNKKEILALLAATPTRRAQEKT